MKLRNLLLDREIASPSSVSKRVAALLAVSVSLGIIQSLWAIALPSGMFQETYPSFVSAIVAFCIGATLSIALLLLARFAFGREGYAFWLGTAFWLSSLAYVAYLVSLQGGSVPLPVSAYLFYLFHLILLLPCLFFIAFSKSPPVPLPGRLPVLAGATFCCLLVIAAVFALTEHLPVVSFARRQNVFSWILPYLFLSLYLGAIWLHWQRLCRTQEPLSGYYLGFLAVSLWTFPAVLYSRADGDLASLSAHLFPAVAGACLYLLLLLDYRALYRALETKLDQMALTHRVNTLVTGSLDLEEICRTLSEEVRKFIRYDRMTISIFQNAVRYRMVFDHGIPRSGVGDRVSWIEEGSATQWIVEHREPVICEDLLQDRRFPSTIKKYEELGVRSYVMCPLIAKGRVLGAVHLGSLLPRSYGKNDVEILAPVLEVLSLAVENATLYHEVRKNEETQRLLKEVSQEITSLDVDSLLKKFSDRVREIFKVDISNVRLIIDGVRHIVGVSGIDAERLRATATGTGRGVSRWMAEKRRPVAIPDITVNTDIPMGETTRAIGVRGYLGVPLSSRNGEFLGIVQALSYEPRHFRQEEIDLLQQLANGLAIAVENSRLLEDLKSANCRLEQSAKDQQTVHEFLSDILLLDLDQLFQKVTEQVAALFQAEYGWLRLFDESGRIRTRVVVGGTVVRTGVAHGESKLRGRSKRMIESRKPLTVRDMAEDAESPYHGTVKAGGMHGFLGAPMFSKDQKPLGLLFVTTLSPRDFTRREIALIEQFARGIAIAIENARLFEETRGKSKELEAAYQARSEFLNTMAHELRTPLSVIIGSQQLLEDGFYGELSEQQQKGLQPISRNAEELLTLINGILDLSRVEAGGVQMEVEEFGLAELMGELEVSLGPLAKEKGLALGFKAIDGMKLRSDRSKVKDILKNLLSNALKYTDRGEIEIGADAITGTEGGKQEVVFSVRDTGIGIPAEELRKVFEPFYMVAGVDRRRHAGSGLGLSIVKRLVKLLGGEIAVESTLGKGSTFKVTIPSFAQVERPA